MHYSGNIKQDQSTGCTCISPHNFQVYTFVSSIINQKSLCLHIVRARERGREEEREGEKW